MISIILPVFNGEKFLTQAIESCLNQTYSNLELIIVNDSSTDNTLNIAKRFAIQDPRVKIISNSRNKRLPASLNIGHKAAQGNFITWTSDDNFFEPEALDVLFTTIEEKEVDIVYSDFNLIEEDGKLRRQFILDQNSSLLLGNVIGACFLYRKEVFDRNCGYDENLHTVEDYDFWLQAALHSRFLHIPNILYNFRSHQNSLSSELNRVGSDSNKIFDEGLRTSYCKFFNSFGYIDSVKQSILFAKLHQHKEIDVSGFLKGYGHFKEEVKQVCNEVSVLDLNNFLCALDIKIRSNIYQYPSNQNFQTLYQCTKHRPVILFSYDRRRSFKIFTKCFKLKQNE